MRSILLACCALLTAQEHSTAAVSPLTTAAELRALDPKEAARRYPVKLRGVVVYLRGAGTSDFVLQDATGGVMTDFGDAHALQLGQEVEVEGFTHTDPPAPRVRVAKLTPGRLVGLPTPRTVSLRELLDGTSEGYFVEFEGVIRGTRIETTLEPARLALDFGPPHRRVVAWVSRFDRQTQGALVPDARVRLRGVCLTWKTASWQPFTSFVVVNDPGLVAVTQPPPQDPFTLPSHSPGELLATRPNEQTAHRQLVRGTATLHWPGQLLVLQDNVGGLRVRPESAAAIAPGEDVEAVGFPALVAAHLELQQALLRRAGSGARVEPSVLSARRIVDGAARIERDAQLVRLPGKLREIERRSGYHVLLMADDGLRFEAMLPASAPLPSTLRPGSDLELTGVCQMLSTEGARQLGKWPDAFEILLPSADSIRIVGAPPWWTFERLASALGGVAALLALVLLWAFALRRRVDERTALLAKEIRARHDSELLAAERQRLAADLHDTLSQTLTGAALQLEIAESVAPPTSAAAAEHLALAQRLVDRSRDELRLAVWDLTPGALIAQGLLPAIENVAREFRGGTGCIISVRAEGRVNAIPEILGTHLFRIAQEAITNAVRHGRAGRIDVLLEASDEAVGLTVKDDGCGFDPAAAPGPKEGHFGLRSLQERVRRLRGSVTIQSASAGSTISAVVPLEREPAISPS